MLHCYHVSNGSIVKIVMDSTDVGTPVDDFVHAMRQRGCVVTMYFDDDNKLVINIKPSMETLQQL